MTYGDLSLPNLEHLTDLSQDFFSSDRSRLGKFFMLVGARFFFASEPSLKVQKTRERREREKEKKERRERRFNDNTIIVQSTIHYECNYKLICFMQAERACIVFKTILVENGALRGRFFAGRAHN